MTMPEMQMNDMAYLPASHRTHRDPFVFLLLKMTHEHYLGALQTAQGHMHDSMYAKKSYESMEKISVIFLSFNIDKESKSPQRLDGGLERIMYDVMLVKVTENTLLYSF